jgi:heparin binding hemagglutinin HbhA
MTQPKTNRIPAPLYAAAGAGELALQQLRKLPTVVSDLGTKVVADLGGKAVVTGFELRQKATETLKTANLTATGLREKAVPADLDLDKLREAATRNAAALLVGAQAAQERALAAYGALIARGERVVGAGVLEAADTVNADIEATDATLLAEVKDEVATAATAAPVEAEIPTPAEVAEVVEAKPATAKTTRARAAKPAATPSAKLPKATKRTRPAAE